MAKIFSRIKLNSNMPKKHKYKEGSLILINWFDGIGKIIDTRSEINEITGLFTLSYVVLLSVDGMNFTNGLCEVEENEILKVV